MEQYIIDMIPSLAQLRDCLQPSLHPFYVCTVLKRFFFCLDVQHRGRIRIRDALESGLVSELLELRDRADQEDLDQEQNQFSIGYPRSVSELSEPGQGPQWHALQEGAGHLWLWHPYAIFLDRVFEECRTYEGEMDYKTFLDFVLALDNRKVRRLNYLNLQALRYLFRILDVDHKGFLTVQTLHLFFRVIQEEIKSHNEEPVNFGDINNEIFDMVNPKDPCKITLQDLIKSGQAETVVSILIEFHKFWAYENREENLQNV